MINPQPNDIISKHNQNLSGINSRIFPPTNPSGPQHEEPKINSTLIEIDLRYLFEDGTENIDQALEILNIASSEFNYRFKKEAIDKAKGYASLLCFIVLQI